MDLDDLVRAADLTCESDRLMLSDEFERCGRQGEAELLRCLTTLVEFQNSVVVEIPTAGEDLLAGRWLRYDKETRAYYHCDSREAGTAAFDTPKGTAVFVVRDIVYPFAKNCGRIAGAREQ